MGIERLHSAAHAAGFAMVGTEEAYEDLEAVPRPAVSQLAELHWRPSRGVPVHAISHETPRVRSDWIGLLLGMLGRRPATRRPALTVGA